MNNYRIKNNNSLTSLTTVEAAIKTAAQSKTALMKRRAEGFLKTMLNNVF
jgi:hypothetical protein